MIQFNASLSKMPKFCSSSSDSVKVASPVNELEQQAETFFSSIVQSPNKTVRAAFLEMAGAHTRLMELALCFPEAKDFSNTQCSTLLLVTKKKMSKLATELPPATLPALGNLVEKNYQTDLTPALIKALNAFLAVETDSHLKQQANAIKNQLCNPKKELSLSDKLLMAAAEQIFASELN